MKSVPRSGRTTSEIGPISVVSLVDATVWPQIGELAQDVRSEDQLSEVGKPSFKNNTTIFLKKS